MRLYRVWNITWTRYEGPYYERKGSAKNLMTRRINGTRSVMCGCSYEIHKFAIRREVGTVND